MAGKRRISMGWISDHRRRHVTFCKRMKGLFKKSQELCCLTGAAVSIVCFSEVGNAFTFSYPPPADHPDANDGRRRFLSIMEQYYARSGGCTIPTTHLQPPTSTPPVVESQSSAEQGWDIPPSTAGNDSLWASLEPLHCGSVSASDRGSLDFGSSLGCVGEYEQQMGMLGGMQSVVQAEAALPELVLGQPMKEEQGVVDSSRYAYSGCLGEDEQEIELWDGMQSIVETERLFLTRSLGNQGSMESSGYDSFDIVSSSNCYYPCLPPPPPLSTDDLPSYSPSSFIWNDHLDFLDIDALEGDTMPSLSF